MAKEDQVNEKEEEEEEEDDELDEPVSPPPVVMRGRVSISAEAYGEWNKLSDYKPPVYEKEPAQIDELKSVMSTSFLFYSLEPKDLEVVVMAMKGPLVLEPGTRVINEGNTGDHLYIVTSGVLDCLKVIDGKETVVKTCIKGSLFGELAVLYSTPRAASVQCREASTVWELDRRTFNSIVLTSVQQKRATCGAALRKVPLFSALTEDELENIVDALKPEKYTEGTTIINQGDEGTNFFIVYQGEVTATKLTPESPDPVHMKHQVGDYFGELALLNDSKRAASVVATSPEVTLLTMDSSTFKRLMGPMEDLLRRSSVRYDQLSN